MLSGDAKRKMDLMKKECCLLLLYFCISSFVLAHGLPHDYSRSLSEDEDLEIEQRLQVLNKPPVKTIKTTLGNVIDCVDMYRQPAFDHPLLKDHKIQMDNKSSSSGEEIISEIFNFSGGCPDGTIPIRRTTKDDLIREKFIRHIDSVLADTPSTNTSGFRAELFAIGNWLYFEAKAQINIWKPQCSGDQFSASLIRLASRPQLDPSPDMNGIYAGWAVYPMLYGDDRPHLFTYWKGDGSSGCYDMRCPGFVQTDKGIVLGDVFEKISVYGGVQYQVEVHIVQDPSTKNWLLKYTPGDRQAGYWPKELFSEMVDGAMRLSFGGLTIHGPDTPSPPMGSGYKPDDEATHSAFMNQIMFRGRFEKARPPFDYEMVKHLDSRECYGLNNVGVKGEFGYFVLFGGPGGAGCTK